MTTVQKMKCHICGAWFNWFPYYAGEQDACPACIAYRDEKIKQGPSEEEIAEQKRKREEYFGK